jgi:hypothetical protein
VPIAVAASILLAAAAFVTRAGVNGDGTGLSDSLQGSRRDAPAQTSRAAPQQRRDITAPQAASQPSAVQQKRVEPPAPVYDEQRLGFALEWARRQAATCTGYGSSVPSVTVNVSFGPDGKVSDATVVEPQQLNEGKVVCIELHYRSALIPAFDGDAFTVTEHVVYY